MKARDAALAAIHGFADRLEKRLPSMVDFSPMGTANYNYYLKHVLLLPLDARHAAARRQFLGIALILGGKPQLRPCGAVTAVCAFGDYL